MMIYIYWMRRKEGKEYEGILCVDSVVAIVYLKLVTVCLPTE